jgi:hypothetical protein
MMMRLSARKKTLKEKCNKKQSKTAYVFNALLLFFIFLQEILFFKTFLSNSTRDATTTFWDRDYTTERIEIRRKERRKERKKDRKKERKAIKQNFFSLLP